MVSRQRAYQLRNHAKGWCYLCPTPTVGFAYCEKHRAMQAARMSRKYRAKGMALRPHYCRVCGGAGHNARTCRGKAAA